VSKVLACEPVACSALTVAHSDTNSISGLTLATHLVTCDDGYISPSGTTFVVACVQAAPGVSIWSNVNSCSVVSCPALTVENSDSYFFAGNTLDSHEVTCDYGFISNAGSSFTVTCMGSGPGASDWSGVQSCDAVPCPFLTIVNSDTISVSGFTLDTHVVSCDSGYTSSAGITFTSTCGATGPRVSSWQNVLDCQAVSCPLLSVSYSSTNMVTGSTLATHTVTCDDGYTSSAGSTFTATCTGTTPGVSSWRNVLTCEPVACAAVTVENSDTESLSGYSLETRLVTCNYGYSSSSGTTFTLTCSTFRPGQSIWTNVLSCEPVACLDLDVVNSDTVSVSGNTLDTHTVRCDIGYTSSSGNEYVAVCSAVGPGLSAWSNVYTCNAVSCPLLSISHSDTTLVSRMTSATHLVTCAVGYTSLAGTSFTATCAGTRPGLSAWINVVSCDAVSCPLLTVSNSDTTLVIGSTSDTHVVQCNIGYTSSAGNVYTAICSGTQVGESEWFNVVSCDPVSCPPLTVLISDTAAVTGLTSATRLVTCNDGYTSMAGFTFTATCAGTADGVSAWSNVLTCDPVVCPAVTVLNSDTSSLAGAILATHRIGCNNGYTSSDGNTFTITCDPFYRLASAWSNVLTCNPVACPSVTIAHSDSTFVSGLTSEEHIVRCQDGYTSSVGS